jgi:endonuclease YncB( thermonuclease family)
MHKRRGPWRVSSASLRRSCSSSLSPYCSSAIAADAPELHQTCKEANGKSWACGRAAKARLTTLIKGGNVNCTARDKDRFGRIAAVCSTEGVPDLGDAMVRQGHAIDLGCEVGNPYHQAEVDAQAGKPGIWRATFERPSDWRLAHPRESE